VNPIRARPIGSARQRGQLLIGFAVVLAISVGALIFNFVSARNTAVENDKITQRALAHAKEALIGYAVSHASQPGVLPCPDTDNDGSADAPCGALGVTSVGRLPWKTLGLPDLRDGMGECLWYAVSANFKNSGTSGPSVVNSGSIGTLAVRDTAGNSVNSGANAALAIVFSPGVTLAGQDRTGTTAVPCGGNTTVGNYLEGGNETGTATDTFVTGPASPAFNDRLLPITRDALFPAVELRVARELRQRLRSYYTPAARRFYPLAAPFPGNASAMNTYRGYVPTTNAGACSVVPDFSGFLPGWFTTNNWQQYMVYSVAPRCTPAFNSSWIWVATAPTCALACTGPFSGLYLCLVATSLNSAGANCSNTGAGSYLTVDGVSNVESLVFSAGSAAAGQTRPCSAIGDCLETVNGDDENIDSPDNYSYVKPSRSSTNNDTLVIVAPPSVP